MIHHAITEHEELDPPLQNWVSLDGEDWLPVQRGPVPSDTDETVEAVFRGDGNFMPLRFARRYLVHLGADFKAP